MTHFPLLRTLGFAAVLASVAGGQTRTFSGQYTFGDSLSDNGNLYLATNRTQPPAPYVNGRFSNGPVFTELLGQAIIPAAGISAQRNNLNFAYGGANAAAPGLVPNLSQQVAQYRIQGLPAQANDLFTVLAGPNDLIPILSSPATAFTPATLDAAGAATAQAVAANVQALVAAGAKNLLVAGIPNLGATPRALASGGAAGAGAMFGLRVSNAFNTELRTRLAAISAAAPDVNVVFLDLQGLTDQISANAAALGFTNTQSFALAPAAQGGGAGNATGYAFWDDIHPTTQTHALIAAVALEQLNPETALGFAAAQGSAALALQSLATSVLDLRTSQVATSSRATGRADAYASFNYADGNRGAAGLRRKFDFDARVVTAGLDWHASEGFLVGAAVGAGRLNADVSANSGSFAVESGTGRLYGIWRGGPVSLLVDGAYGTLRVKDAQRRTALGGLPVRSKASGEHWGVGGKVLWTVDMGTVNVRPWLGLRTERVQLDRAREQGVSFLDLQVEDQEAVSTQGSVGVDATTTLRLAGRAVRLDARGAWRGEFGSDTRTVAGRLAENVTRPTSITVEDGDGEGFEAGAAATLFFSRNWSGSLGYAADLRSGDKVAHRFSLSLQTGF